MEYIATFSSVSHPTLSNPNPLITLFKSPDVGLKIRLQNTDPAATDIPMVEEKIVLKIPIPG